jgi:serpin B
MTKNGPFFCGDGSIVRVPMMNKDTLFFVSESDLFQAIDLPYGRHGYSMTILLPKEGVTVDQLIAQMTPEKWDAWMGAFVERETYFAMPKLTLEYDASLKGVLAALGMPIAFGDQADFSNMVDSFRVYIDDVLHKTFLKVDERGTEAAAVTAVVIMPTCLSGIFVNRPYVMAIREKESGTIVFLGRIAAPEWKDD